ncbi:MAG: choice-of-anchor D domain-containing protein [Terriglobales bacterium]|jgi:hypothetical protein
MRRLNIEVLVKTHSLLCRFGISFILAGSLLLLTSCQGLGGGSNQTGTPGILSLNPSQLTFTSTKVGANQTSPVTLSNSGGSDLIITQATLSGAGFSMSNLALPLTIHAGSSASATITFAPTATGSFSGSVTFAVTSNQSNSQVVLSFTGTGAASGTLSPNPSSLAFGSIQVGSNGSQFETLTNTTASTVTISQASASGAGFSISGLAPPVALVANQSVTFTATFTPASPGAASGAVSIVSDAPDSPLSIPLSGTGVPPGSLATNPETLAFPSVQVGNSANLSETLTNTGGSTVTLSQANLTGAAFSISGLTLPLDLTPNHSVTFTATFTPDSVGAASGSLSVVSNASNSPLSIALSGTGTAAGQLAVSPASLSFGKVAVGSNSQLSGTLTATGAPVTVTSASLNSSEFAVSGISFPATIAVGQPATFTVTFTPASTGLASASLSFASNASNSPAAQSMTGTGTASPHYVDLSWDASTDAVGYNIYRSATSGSGYTKINTPLDGTTAYTDNTVAAGQTYYYVTTAVDSSQNESGYSNAAKATVPSS